MTASSTPHHTEQEQKAHILTSKSNHSSHYSPIDIRHGMINDLGLGIRKVRGVTVSFAGERVPPYTVNEWP